MTDIHETAGPYAVDALEPAERVEYEAHLARCPACQLEVAEFCEAVAQLSLLSPAAPRPRLRDRVLHAVRTTPGSETLSLVPEVAGPVDELAQRRQERRSRVLSGLVAAALALAVGLGGVVYVQVQDRYTQVAQTSLEERLYAAPDAVRTTNVLPGGGQVTLVASKQLDRALFVGTGLPDPGSNRYQLWTATGTDWGRLTAVTRDVQVTVADGEAKVFFEGDIAGADFMAVNLEPAASTPAAPTSPVLASGPTGI